MLCVIALVVFGVMGIFSLKYRTLAKEALNCTFRRVTLRNCDTGLDKKVKSMFVGKIGKKHPRLGRILYKYFEVFTWILILITIWSIYEIGKGAYNYIEYGSCIKPGDSGVCVLNLQESLYQQSSVRAEYPLQRINPGLDGPSKGNENSDVIVIIYGCFTCPYTHISMPKINELVEEFKSQALFIFKDFPILNHRNALETVKSARCAYNQNKYFEARELLYETSRYHNDPIGLATALDLNISEFEVCFNSNETEAEALLVFEEGINAHVKATPTVFVNNESISGSGDSDILKLRQLIESNLK